MSRKHLIQLVMLVLAGWALGQVLRRAVPVGRDLGRNATVAAVLADRSYPMRSDNPATLTLVVFTDYQCPACKLAHDAMERAVAADGRVRLIYRDWPIFGPMSERAARITLAADHQGIYPELHARLMRERRPLTEAVLREDVVLSAGDWAKIVETMKTRAGEIDRMLSATRTTAFALGIAGTPAYLAGPVIALGANDEAGFRRLFAEGRAAAKKPHDGKP